MFTSENQPSIFRQFLDTYAQNPRQFVRDVLGVTPQPWQDDVLAAYQRGDRRISIRSGHGVGKSALLAWIMLHMLLCRFPQNTVVTAPSSTQLWDALWKEFRVWIGKLPAPLRQLLEVKSERVELLANPAASFVSARTARAEQPDALQGVHCEEGWVLLVCDEASGIPEAVFEAASGSMSGTRATTILCGNPVRTQGLFYDSHTKLRDMWTTQHVSCFDSPLATGADFIEDIRRRYGEQSNAYRIRVLGEFPIAQDDAVIPYDLVEAALTRDIQPSWNTPTVWGLDCARSGGDRSALAKRRGQELIEPVRWWREPDAMVLAGKIKLEFETCPLKYRPAEINVDVIGMGGPILDRLRQLGLPARGINVAESPALINSERYHRLRDELWFKGREWFARRDCKLPQSYARARPEDDLVRELTVPTYDYFPKGGSKVKVQSKDDMKGLGMESPDLADAFLLTLASDALTLTHGSFGQTSWRNAQHRPLKSLV